MQLNAITILGLIAGTVTTAAFFPQVIKTWRTRSAQDLSLVMFLTLIVGICLWLIYGLLLGDLPLIAANLVTLVAAGVILYFKVRYG